MQIKKIKNKPREGTNLFCFDAPQSSSELILEMLKKLDEIIDRVNKHEFFMRGDGK